MKFSETWLREFVNPKVTTEKLADQLTMHGLEVASFTKVAPDFNEVVVGEVLEAEKHPNADKLSVCKVDVKGSETLTIVCGAANVRKGLKVAVALVGAVLPNNFKIQKAKLRGVESFGMICSSLELGLAETSVGILELSEAAPVGVPFREYLALDDTVFDLELTANRGDCLSVLGVAREVAAINHLQLTEPDIITQDAICADKSISVKIKAKEACPNYLGRVIRNINPQAKTPDMIKERLRRMGVRSIHPVVDVLNYVMFEIGQPMHAFDLTKITVPIEVRYSNQGERLKLLDGKEVELEEKTLVIADAKSAVAIAGVMGGLESAIDETSKDIFLESAFFAPAALGGIARCYGLQTDASYRFERGVDPNLQLKALHRATALLLKIVGGTPGEIITETAKEFLPLKNTINLPHFLFKKLIGFDIDTNKIHLILNELGMKVKDLSEYFEVTPPSYRFDINIPEDLVEELARIHGYMYVPELPVIAEILNDQNNNQSQGDQNTPKLLKRLSELFVDKGYHEIITYSFTDPKLEQLLKPNQEQIVLANPISPELSVMRSTLWSGLINAAKYNLCRKQLRVRFFETGLCFLKDQASELKQTPFFAGIVLGCLNNEAWDGINHCVDFYDLKNDVEHIFRLFGISKNISFSISTCESLHPKRSADILLGGKIIGCIGELHPGLAQKLELSQLVYLFEINLSFLNKELQVKFSEISRFPMIERDIAIIVDEGVSWEKIKQKILDTGSELLHNIQVFDVYRGANIGSGKKSFAIHMIFKHLTRTLVDAEVESDVNKIVLVLKQEFNAELRG